eukprot:UN23289
MTSSAFRASQIEDSSFRFCFPKNMFFSKNIKSFSFFSLPKTCFFEQIKI